MKRFPLYFASAFISATMPSPAMALKTDSNLYYLELSAGNKTINSTQINADARVGKVGAFVHFQQLFGLGLTAAKVEYGADNAAWGKAPDAGTEFGVESRLLTPSLNFYEAKLSAFLSLGGTVDSNSRRRSLSEPGEVSLSLTGRSEATEITEIFRSIGPAASLGFKLDFMDQLGLQVEYAVGREKWITSRAVYQGRESAYQNLEEALMTRQLIFGLSFIN